MALTLHTNWQYGSYLADRNQLLKSLENPMLAGNNLYYLRPYYDGSIAVGYGFDLLTRSVAEARTYITGVGGTFAQQAETLLNQYRTDLAAGIVNATYIQNLANNLRNYVSLPSEPAAVTLLNNVTAQIFEPAISLADLPESKERVAIISYMYNLGAAGIPTTLNLIRNGQADPAQRAKIWFEIRYNNINANLFYRRQVEANLFGLFDTANGAFGGNDAEARIALGYLYSRQTLIDSRGYGGDFNAQVSSAKVYLQNTYTNGYYFDRVINDTYEQNSIAGTIGIDLIFGNGSNDIIYGGGGGDYIYGGIGSDSLVGEDGNDVLYGESGLDYLAGGNGDDELDGGGDADYLEGGIGSDILRGGDGDDWLRGGIGQDLLAGGQGQDIYLYNTGEGVDTIYDYDGLGRVVFDGVYLAGGRREEGASSYVSSDGRFSYSLSGSTLVINGNLIIESFTNRNLGIVLLEPEDSDEPEDPDNPNEPDDPNNPQDAGDDNQQGNDDGDDQQGDLGDMDDIGDGLDEAGRRRTISPIVLDLNGDGIQTSSLENGVYFDFNDDGFRSRTGFVAGGDGLLVVDLNGNSYIDSGRELFGDNTLLADGTPAANGFAALAQYDGNLDGVIDAQDAIFPSLQVWIDANQSGFSELGELRSLDELGIASLTLDYVQDGTFQNGNEIRYVSSFTRLDDTSHGLADVYFAQNSTDTVARRYREVTPSIAALPDVYGFGKVRNLQQAMVYDRTGLLEWLVTQYVGNIDNAYNTGLLDEILYRWAGTDDVDPTAVLGSVNLRQLRTLEAFLGYDYTGQTAPVNANAIHGSVFPQLQGFLEERLLKQSYLRDYYNPQVYDLGTMSWLISDPAGYFNDYFSNKLLADDSAALAELTLLRSKSYLSGDLPSEYSFQRVNGSWIINSGVGDDLIHGGDGNDTLTDAGGSNSIDGGAGDDRITLGTSASGTNTIRAGEGNDTVILRVIGDRPRFLV